MNLVSSVSLQESLFAFALLNTLRWRECIGPLVQLWVWQDTDRERPRPSLLTLSLWDKDTYWIRNLELQLYPGQPVWPWDLPILPPPRSGKHKATAPPCFLCGHGGLKLRSLREDLNLDFYVRIRTLILVFSQKELLPTELSLQLPPPPSFQPLPTPFWDRVSCCLLTWMTLNFWSIYADEQAQDIFLACWASTLPMERHPRTIISILLSFLSPLSI